MALVNTKSVPKIIEFLSKFSVDLAARLKYIKIRTVKRNNAT